MKRCLWLLPVVLFWVLAPLPPSGQHAGAYNYTSHLMYCRTELACLHEVGHRLDQHQNYPSQSQAFVTALQMWLLVELRKPTLETLPVSVLDLTYRNGNTDNNLREIYAYLFAWSNGNPDLMPAGLRSFYDWQDAQRLLSILNEQQKIYWLN